MEGGRNGTAVRNIKERKYLFFDKELVKNSLCTKCNTTYYRKLAWKHFITCMHTRDPTN
jgi:hypothetical protein